MITISKIILKNIQIHRNLAIDFTHGTNTIVGVNNGGKSSIIRAIQWVMTNQPAGHWMRTVLDDGTLARARVNMVFNDGTVVTRIRSDKENKYLFNDEVFENFGRDVPDPIKEYFGNIKAQFGNVERIPCISSQDDPLFMIFESGPVRGALLNYLTGIDIADKIKRDLNKSMLSLTRDINQKQKNIDELREQKKKYKGLAGINKRQKRIEKLYNTSTQLNEKIYDAMIEFYDLQDLRRELKKKQKFAKAVTPLVGLYNKWNSIKNTIQGSEKLLTQYNVCQHIVNQEKRIGDLVGLIEQHRMLQKKVNLMKTDKIGLTALSNDLRIANADIIRCTAELKKYDICPLCGGDM